jgi:hypothetical protein
VAALTGFAGALGGFFFARLHRWLDAYAEARRRRRLVVRLSIEEQELTGFEKDVRLPERYFSLDVLGQAIPRTARLFVVSGANADRIPVTITGAKLQSSLWRWPWIVLGETPAFPTRQTLAPSDPFCYRAHVGLFPNIVPAGRRLRWWVRAVVEDSTGGRRASRPVRFP